LTIDVSAIGELLHVKRDERGSTPLLEATAREGFGAILEKAVLTGLGGTISRDWNSNGVSPSLKIPLPALVI
jgi:hypothetical protein